MPKKEITDYVIYKIICNDENIKDCYVGSTSNFKVRKWDHAKNCNGNIVNYKIYETIRENGGWTNWTMIPVAEHKELTSIQARIKEEEYRVNLNAQLNSKAAYRSEEETRQLENVQSKKYYEANKEQLSEQRKQFYQENKEELKERSKKWRENNPEKTKEINRKHNQSEERKAYMKEYNKQYREKLKQKQEK